MVTINFIILINRFYFNAINSNLNISEVPNLLINQIFYPILSKKLQIKLEDI